MGSNVPDKKQAQENGWQMAMIRVALHSDLTYQSGAEPYVLKLPQTDEQLRAVLERLGIKTFGECEILWVDSPLRVLKTLSYDGDISLMNDLAKVAAQAFNGGNDSTMLLLAALDAFRYNGKDVLKECLEHLDRYELLPKEYCTPEAYGKHLLYCSPLTNDVHVDESMRPYIDFEKYGRAMMKKNNIIITDIGWLAPKVSSCKLYMPLSCKTGTGYELDAQEMALFYKQIHEQIGSDVKGAMGARGLSSSTISAYYTVGRVLSAFPGIEVQKGELWGCLNITKLGWIPEKEWESKKAEWREQIKYGWGEQIRTQGIVCKEGTLYLDFWDEDVGHRFFSEKELEEMEAQTDWLLQ